MFVSDSVNNLMEKLEKQNEEWRLNLHLHTYIPLHHDE